MDKEVKSEQFWNALFPMEVTLFGITIEVKPLHPLYLQLIVYQIVLIIMVEN